jgi:Domain of unknown function (DUF5916)
MKAMGRLFICLCAIASAIAVFAMPSTAAGEQFSLDAARAKTPPKLDGTLDDPQWQTAAHTQLGWDYSFRRPASDKTDVYLLSDDHAVYVAYVVQQTEAITATQTTNDVGLGADDVVRTYFWPGGDQGFEYMFAANAIGTRYEFSTENTSFAPRWTAVSKKTATGYVVTESIPLDAMRGDGRATWRLQFDRRIHLTGQLFEWAHDPAANGTDAVTYSGYLGGMTALAASTRTKPRLGVYALGQLGSSIAGGDTSRVGADLALPITDTASFFGTLHPDYSNVELDQQTIAPTAFARKFSEVRPFFTQGSSVYNEFNCNDCIDAPFVYTPAIPTPRDGYAVEGVQGRAQFAAFDALGVGGRSDDSEALALNTPDRRISIDALRFGTSLPGLFDDTALYQLTVGNVHNFSVYGTYGGESGTGVSNGSLGAYREYGLNLFTPKSGLFAAYHDVGSQFAPPDTFFQINDVVGPSAFAEQEWDNAPTSFIQSFTLQQDYQHYRNHSGTLDFSDAFTNFEINTKTLYQLALSSGYQYIDGLMADQNGIALNYGESSSTPSLISYNIGRWGDGYLRATTRFTTLKLGARGTLGLEDDNTNDTTDHFGKYVQWLERASVAYQISPSSSFAVGVRRVIGIPPVLQPPADLVSCPFVPGLSSPATIVAGACPAAPNISFSYYRRFGSDELYFVYGNPNAAMTSPALIIKFIHYIGAEKGT